MSDYKEYEILKDNSLYIEELYKLPKKFRNLPIKYTISYLDFVKYVNIAKSTLKLKSDSIHTIHAYFSRYYTCKLDENGEHSICSIGVTDNNGKDYELNRFSKNENDNYRIEFNSCSFALFITFIDLITCEKFEIGELC